MLGLVSILVRKRARRIINVISMFSTKVNEIQTSERTNRQNSSSCERDIILLERDILLLFFFYTGQADGSCAQKLDAVNIFSIFFGPNGCG